MLAWARPLGDKMLLCSSLTCLHAPVASALTWAAGLQAYPAGSSNERQRPCRAPPSTLSSALQKASSWERSSWMCTAMLQLLAGRISPDLYCVQLQGSMHAMSDLEAAGLPCVHHTFIQVKVKAQER